MTTPPLFAHRREAALFLLLSLAVPVAVVLLPLHLYPVCLFHALTGLHCPGCGTGRGLRLILSGHILQGLRQNPLLGLVIPYAFALNLEAALTLLGRPGLVPADPGRTFRGLLVASVLAYAILRNLPFPPFNLLAPP